MVHENDTLTIYPGGGWS